MEEQEAREAIKARIEHIEAQAIADAIAQSEGEMQGVKKAALTFAERAGIALEEAIRAILNAPGAGWGLPELEEEKGELLNFQTARDRKEARRKRQAVEQATASRFR